jgi:hypothetical protein
MHARADTAVSWPEEIFSILQRFEVRQVPYVPDAGHSELIERVLGSSSMRGIALTTEEEGVALLAGAWAGGQRGVLLQHALERQPPWRQKSSDLLGRRCGSRASHHSNVQCSQPRAVARSDELSRLRA